MPEMLEVESYRRVAARTVGRRIGAVEAPDSWYLKGGVGPVMLADLVVGAVVSSVDRRGKLLLVHLDRGEVLGLRFGMTGRLLLEEPGPAGATRDPVGALEYGPKQDRARWRRFALGFTDGSRLVMTDPRRLGGVWLNPSVARIGPEADRVGSEDLGTVLAGRSAPLKAVLMDQQRLAGLGNLLTDEVLWRARLSPLRPASELDAEEVTALADVIAGTVAELGRRGGSHTGDLQPSRTAGGTCPRCGEALRRDEVGGRTTWWCPAEQR